jgi:hypothetical protein
MDDGRWTMDNILKPSNSERRTLLRNVGRFLLFQDFPEGAGEIRSQDEIPRPPKYEFFCKITLSNTNSLIIRTAVPNVKQQRELFSWHIGRNLNCYTVRKIISFVHLKDEFIKSVIQRRMMELVVNWKDYGRKRP